VAYLGLTRKRAVQAEEVKKGGGGGVLDGMVEEVLKAVTRAIGEVGRGIRSEGRNIMVSFFSFFHLF